MAVTWVGGAARVLARESLTVSVALPAGLAAGDSVMVAVTGVSALSGPAGWTKAVETAVYDRPGSSEAPRLALFTKNTVTGADSGQSFVFTQASAPDGSFISAICAVGRGASSLAFQSAITALVNSFAITPPTATPPVNGCLIVVFAASALFPPLNPATAEVNPTPPTGFTLTGTSAPFDDCNLSAAYRLVSLGQPNSGAFAFSAETPQAVYGVDNRLGCITVLLAPAGGGSAVEGIASAAGPLGAPACLASHSGRVARVAAPTMLGQPRILAAHDFTGALGDRGALIYVMDLLTPGGRVRVPISSWQATLQVEQSNYLQCVVPACLPFVAQINAATSFQITRQARLPEGSVFEYPMAAAPLQTVITAQGTNNFTATLSGYSPGLVLVGTPPPSAARVLQGVRTVFTQPGGLRVRCSIDWLLRPGQLATLDGASFLVSYINYYVTDGDQYMDVGERVEPT